MKDYSDWIGISKSLTDTIDARQANLMAATMSQDARFSAGDKLPMGWHWIYFLEAMPTDRLGLDGHAARGGFLPPVDLPRRMWAGGRLAFHNPIIIGETYIRRSTITQVSEKSGSTGRLCFVTVLHEIFDGDDCLLSETQDLVYREEPKDGEVPRPIEAPKQPDESQAIVPDPVWLFRYSALTFNGHRIHYDHPHATGKEGYPGLIFHGPLTATLLMALAEKMTSMPIEWFKFRGVAPIFDTGQFMINGKLDSEGLQLWALTQGGSLGMSASAG